MHFGSETVHVVDNFISPNETGVMVDNNQSFLLQFNKTYSIKGTNATIALTGLIYAPIEHTVTLELCATSPSNSVSNTVKSILSLNITYDALPLQLIVTSDNAITVQLVNIVNAPNAPSGLSDISATNVIVNSSLVASLNINVQFSCSAKGAAPYVLKNGVWEAVVPYTYDNSSNVCAVKFNIPSNDPVIGIMQKSKSVVPQKPSVSTTVAPTTTVQQQSTTSSTGINKNLLAVFVILLVAIVAAIAYYTSRSRKGTNGRTAKKNGTTKTVK